MPLMTLKSILGNARAGGYAVGAFNINNMEIFQAVVRAAVERSSPVIIQVSEGAIEYAGLACLVAMVRSGVSEHDLPFALHLDHGKNLDVVAECLNAGFTSVMIDGSSLPFDENVALTRKTVEMARAKGVSVEGEIGVLSGIEDGVSAAPGEALLTDPDEARSFVEKTGVDALAIAVGTSHGAYKFKGRARLDHDRIRAVRDAVGIPLVLHGASGVDPDTVGRAEKYGARLAGARGIPDDAIRQAVSCGICKVNIDTDLRLAFTTAVREVLNREAGQIDPRKILGPARDAMTRLVAGKMNLFGCSGRAG